MKNLKTKNHKSTTETSKKANDISKNLKFEKVFLKFLSETEEIMVQEKINKIVFISFEVSPYFCFFP